MGTRWGKVFGGEKTETTEPITSQMSICLKYFIHSHQTQALMAKKKVTIPLSNKLTAKKATNKHAVLYTLRRKSNNSSCWVCFVFTVFYIL